MLLIWASCLVRILSLAPQRAELNRNKRTIGLIFGLMFFNATVVFGPNSYWHLFLQAMLIAGGCWCFDKHHQIQSLGDS